MKKINMREIAVMDAESGTISLYTLPRSVKTDEDIQEYLHFTLGLNTSSEWIAAKKIILTDFRTKKIHL